VESIERTDWEAVVTAFAAFFEGLGTVLTDFDIASFSAGGAGTGLVLGRDGTSTSFMPLHGLNAHWDTVAFDRRAGTVVVSGEAFDYTYRYHRHGDAPNGPTSIGSRS